MNNFLTTSDERDRFLQWLESQKDNSRPQKGQSIEAYQNNREMTVAYYHYARGAYEAYLTVLAYVKSGGKF